MTVEEASRRFILKRAAITAGGGLVCGAAAWTRHDPYGLNAREAKPRLALPAGGYAVAPNKMLPALGVATGQNVDRLVRGAVDAIGGIQRFIKTGDVVVVKPNVAF